MKKSFNPRDMLRVLSKLLNLKDRAFLGWENLPLQDQRGLTVKEQEGRDATQHHPKEEKEEEEEEE